MIIEITLTAIGLAVASGGALWIIYRVPVKGGPRPTGAPEMTPEGFKFAVQNYPDMASAKNFPSSARPVKLTGRTWRKINAELRFVASRFTVEYGWPDFFPAYKGNCDNFAALLANRLFAIGIDKAAMRICTCVKGRNPHVALIVDTDHGAYGADLGATSFQPTAATSIPGLGIEKITLIQQAGDGDWLRVAL